ncbi:TetR/AcrR family transcriptional regulator [Terriglobus roseus]|nr:TetR/AcrR family transcriptional regulator [Terriglobus roseus]
MLTDLRRGEIIAAAMKVFAKKGFSEARAEDVAAQAGIAKGTLYLYFDSKEAIYEAALKHAMTALGATVAARVGAAATAEERIRAWVGARIDFWGGQGDLYRMILTLGREKKHRKQTATLLRESVDSFMNVLRMSVASGELKDRPLEPISWTVLDMIRGANERRIDGLSIHDAGSDTEGIVETVMRYFA